MTSDAPTPATPAAAAAAAGPPAPRATRREWLGLAAIALPCAVYAMDMTVLNLALPAISAELRPSPGQLLWIVDAYGFLVAGFLITMGTLGDRIGRRRLLLIGAAAFAAASALAALSDSAEMLIGMRALLGIAGATVAPSTMSLIRNMFHDERERQFAIGIWIAAFSAGAAIGPLVGGVLLAFFGWQAAFLVAVPVMLLLLLVGPRLLPEYRDPGAGRLDLPSVALSLAAVWPTVYGLKKLAEAGLAPLPVACLLAGLGVGLLFVRRQMRLDDPLLDLGLLRGARFSAALAAYGLSSLAMMGVFLYFTQYLQGVRGLGPLQAGLVTAPWALAFVVGSLLAPGWAQRWPARRILVAGLVAAAAGFAAVALAGGPATLPLMLAGMVLMSLGMAPVFTVGNAMIIDAAPAQRAGAASAIAETVAELSAALGVALFGSLGAVLYRQALDRTLPEGLPPEAVAAAAATIGAAVDVAGRLPAADGALLLARAREAFTAVLQLNAGLGAGIVLLAALLAGVILGRRPG
ncbi:MFS transporter [Piscinibacter sakaiensis]|uniref:Major facilitator superfamily (MFS) profile domain-containing protein n=1 Tax=Piscinibacter sakaiensis TaxID=1547922 RepID=A0A0K8P8Q1_PISS1|nr:MFS transporter [Piscinibacter sakaiensis]GAP39011.1 hypothetical protein ISF6_0430 [Piscinibacter sakaiensis]